MLVGQDERQLGGLIVPRAEAIVAWAAEAGVSVAQDLGGQPGDPALLRLLMRECNRLLKQRSGSRGDERLAGWCLWIPSALRTDS